MPTIMCDGRTLRVRGASGWYAGRKAQVGIQANPNSFKPRPYRCVKFFGIDRIFLILSSQEKFLSLVIVARTVNRHRWVG